MKKWILGLSVLGLGLSASSFAGDKELDEIRAKLKDNFPNLSEKDVRHTPVEGLYEVSRGLSFGYVTKDGKFFLDGDLIDLSKGVSLTESSRKELRLAEMEKIGEDKMIIFPAKKEKHQITVFTDIDCGYCRKLHREMRDYNREGITVRYVFYPRSGPNTPSFAKAENVWCAQDRQDAMTEAKQGKEPAAQQCDNPVLEHFMAGQRLGIRGTPALVLDDGSLQPGYVPAARLAQQFAKLDK